MLVASKRPITIGKLRSPSTSRRTITCWSSTSLMMIRRSSIWTGTANPPATRAGGRPAPWTIKRSALGDKDGPMTAYEPAELSVETKRANARLRAALGRTDQDFALARTLVKTAQQPVPDVGPGVSVDVRHIPGHPTGTDWWAVTRVGSVVRVVLADAAGPSTPAGATVPLFLRTLANRYADLAPGKF